MTSQTRRDSRTQLEQTDKYLGVRADDFHRVTLSVRDITKAINQGEPWSNRRTNQRLIATIVTFEKAIVRLLNR